MAPGQEGEASQSPVKNLPWLFPLPGSWRFLPGV